VISAFRETKDKEEVEDIVIAGERSKQASRYDHTPPDNKHGCNKRKECNQKQKDM